MKYSDYEQIKLVNFSAQQNFGVARSSAFGAVKGTVKGASVGSGVGAAIGAGKAMVQGIGTLVREGKRGRTYGVGAATRLLGKMATGSIKGAKTGAGVGAVAGLAYGATKGAIKGAGKDLGSAAKSGAKEVGGLKKLGSEVAADFRKAAGMNSPKVADVNPELYYLIEHVKGGVELIDKKGYGDRDDAKMVLDRKTGNSRSEHSILKGTTLAQKYAGQFKLNYNS